MSRRPDICIYHANCMDGFTAAWVVARKFPDVELVPASYGDAPPDVRGKTVLIVDFSYAKPVLEAMAAEALLVVVLDHHKTAESALADFEVKDIWFSETQGTICSHFWGRPGRLIAHFDMGKSGARLAYQFCHPGYPSPPLVDYVEDRDLWRWTLPESREINAAIASYEQTLKQWDALDTFLGHFTTYNSLLAEGTAILRQRYKDIEALIGAAKREMRIGGHLVEVVNAPFFLASDIGERLSADKPFAATYYDTGDGRAFSLRSQEGGVHSLDVSEIARSYGGGGHRHAAGFKMPHGWEGDTAPNAGRELVQADGYGRYELILELRDHRRGHRRGVSLGGAAIGERPLFESAASGARRLVDDWARHHDFDRLPNAMRNEGDL